MSWYIIEHMDYEPVIGLEVHAELQTRSKMFCGCAVVDSTKAEPNLYVCPVCTGMPGSLPVVNQRAVEYGIMVGLALHCRINPINVFSRKSYFYPDLPKGYQISQYDLPFCRDGWLTIELDYTRRTPCEERRIGIRRVHLEEDTGKLLHRDGISLVDFNRSGVPLLEIVSEPDLHSLDEVRAYATKLRSILRYLGVNSGDMEKGVIRFEANVSVRPAGSTQLYTRTEIKNLNSFRALLRAVEYEINRQTALMRAGGAVKQQTLGWDEGRGMTVPQRSKEFAEDYRYFPEPDLPPLEISPAWVEQIAAQLPELPDAKRERFMRDYGLSRYDAGVLVAERAVADYFEQAVHESLVVSVANLRAQAGPPISPKSIANWITGEIFRLMKETDTEIEQVRVTPAHLVALIRLVEAGTINANTGKEVLSEMFMSGRSAEAIVQERGLAQISEESVLAQVVAQVLAGHPNEVQTYLSGKETVARWLMGQVMRATQGKANPALAQRLLEEQLARLKSDRSA